MSFTAINQITTGATTDVHVIGKCPVKGCKNRRRNTYVGVVKGDRFRQWTEWKIPAPGGYDKVTAGLSERSPKHVGWGSNARPSQYLANNRHAYDAAWFAAVESAGWICAEHDRFMVTVEVKGVVNVDKTCDGRCRNAVGPNCECPCGGLQHGAAYSFG